MVTAKDVARLAEVSISTVGRALSDDSRISPSTKAKVKKAANKLGYVSNMPARMMRGGSSNMIGLLIPDVKNDFYAAIAQVISQTCDQEGYRLLLSITGDDREIEARHIRELKGARVAGVIIVPTARPLRETVQMLETMPYVQFLRHVPKLGVTCFGMDDELALYTATSHLLELGHKRIAYVGGSNSLSTGAARLRGFRRAITEAGLDTNHTIESLGQPTHEHGTSTFESLMVQDQPPTAIVTGSVHVTMGLIETVEKLDIDIPGTVSVVGFGNALWYSWWRGGLTTVRPPVQELASTCGLWFLNRLKTGGELEKLTNQGVTISSSLIMRSSTIAYK